MKKALINQLKLELMDHLTIEEKGEVIRKLNREHGLSMREIGRILNIPASTVMDWAKPYRPKFGPGNLHVSIDTLIEHFKIYVPKTWEEKKKLKLLIVVLMDCQGRLKDDDKKSNGKGY